MSPGGREIERLVGVVGAEGIDVDAAASAEEAGHVQSIGCEPGSEIREDLFAETLVEQLFAAKGEEISQERFSFRGF